MALKYAPLCTKCNVTRTQHPTGLCSVCRRSSASRLCKICGVIQTNHASGICHNCRRSCTDDEDRLQKAIKIHETTTQVLRLRAAKLSFSEIARAIDMSKTATYHIYVSALHLPDWAVETLESNDIT